MSPTHREVVALDGVSIIVVNYQSHALVDANLSEAGTEHTGAHCIVVDSFSTMDERNAMAAVCERRGWRLIALDGNPGFGEAANAGARAALAAGCDTLLFLNPDARLSIADLRILIQGSRRRPDHLLAPRMTMPGGAAWSEPFMTDRRTGLPGRRPAPGDGVKWVTGACFVTSAAQWSVLGGFDGEYFMYWEDVDLSYRCLESGGGVDVVPDATAFHEVGATQGPGKSPLYIRYCCQNRLVFAAKHLGRADLLRWILWTPRASWLITRRAGGRRVLLRSPTLLWAMVRGTAGGARSAIVRLLR